MEPETRCRYDRIQVFDGHSPDSADSKLLGTYCGHLGSSAVDVKSSGSDLLIRMTSDGSVTAQGFSLSFVSTKPGTDGEKEMLVTSQIMSQYNVSKI